MDLGGCRGGLLGPAPTGGLYHHPAQEEQETEGEEIARGIHETNVNDITLQFSFLA